MAGKFDADWTEELSLEVESCPKHSGFTLDFICKQCRTNVCVRCVALDHHDHDIGSSKSQKVQISEPSGNLEKRDVKIMKRKSQEMLEMVNEITKEHLFSIEQDRDRKISLVKRKRNDFDRHVKGITECQNPQLETYADLEAKYDMVLSFNRIYSSSNTTLIEWESTSFCSDDSVTKGPEPGQPRTSFEVGVECPSTCRRKSETSGMKVTRGAEGGLAFKSDREGVIKGQMKEDEKRNDAHSQRDDVVLFDLAMQLLPEHLTPLGLYLHLSNVTIKHIRCDNSSSIVNAIYEVLQKWKGTLHAKVITVENFKKLEHCLRKIGNEDAADWLIERLQKSPGQLVQPSSSPGHLGRPSSSPGHLGRPSSSPGHLGRPSSSPGHLGRPSSSPGHLGRPSSSPAQLWQPSSTLAHLGQPSSTPAQLGQPSSSSGQLVQPSSSPGQLGRPSSSPAQLGQPSSTPGLVQLSSTPGQLGQPSSIPGLVQPSSSPGLVQLSSTPGLVQPSSTPGQLGQPSSTPGLVQPSSTPGLVQPSSSPGQLGQPSSSDSH